MTPLANVPQPSALFRNPVGLNKVPLKKRPNANNELTPAGFKQKLKGEIEAMGITTSCFGCWIAGLLLPLPEEAEVRIPGKHVNC